MIQTETVLNIADNSGAKSVRCIQIPKTSKASIGDIIIVSIQKLNPKKGLGKLKKGEVCYCLIVRTKFKVQRKDGTFLKFNENSGILLTKKGKILPVGSRSFGASIRELRKKYNDLVSKFERIF